MELPSSNHPAFQDGYPETVPVAPQYFPAPPRVQAYKTHVVRCPVFLEGVFTNWFEVPRTDVVCHRNDIGLVTSLWKDLFPLDKMTMERGVCYSLP